MRFSGRLALASILAALSALALASGASATSHHPTGEFERFGECPLSRSTIEYCLDTEVDSGSYELGSKTVPIVNPITLQGGYEGSAPIEFFGAENGVTLSKAPEPVPGGLLGLTAPNTWPAGVQEWFNDGINEGLTGMSATIELVAPATLVELSLENLLEETGTALGLQVRIHLESALLGSNCYVATEPAPLSLELTTGESGSLSGSPGELTFNPSFTIATFEGLRLVDGAVAEPEAAGCGGIYSSYVDPFINSVLNLSASGEFSLEGMLSVGEAAEVRAHDM